MSKARFKSFLRRVREGVHPLESATIVDPESPPDWEGLGWKVGWIVEESYSGLQWWLTGADDWEKLTASLGNNRGQKTQTFLDWYSKVLTDLSSDLGVPLDLETIRWRQVDLTALVDRPRIVEETWWQVSITDDDLGTWTIILPQRFYHLFEEDETGPDEAQPPWVFPELWEQLKLRQKRRLLELIGPERGLRNHLASLILADELEPAEIRENLPRQPWEELKRTLEERRSILESQESRQKKQTLGSWKHDARLYLAKQVGEWLESGELAGEGWGGFESDWEQFRLDQLSSRFGDPEWAELWGEFTNAELRQLVPRVDPDKLARSAVQLDESQRSRLHEHLSADGRRRLERVVSEQIEDNKKLKAREQVFEQVKKLAEKRDFIDLENWGK